MRRENLDHLSKVKERWADSLFQISPGDGVINLYNGDPGVPPPESVRTALRDAATKVMVLNGARRVEGDLELHTYRFPDPFEPSLRKAVIHDLQRSGIPVDPGEDIEIRPVFGVTQAVAGLMHGFSVRNEPILIPTPTYSFFFLTGYYTDGDFHIMEPNREGGYQINADYIARGLLDYPDSRALLLLNPVNPTGQVIPEEELEKIGRLAFEKDLTLIVDEIYKDLVLEPDVPFRSIAAMTIDGKPLYHRTVTLRGVSKCQGLAKARIGYLAGHHRLMERLSTDGYFWSTTMAPGELDQIVAAAALEGATPEYYEHATSVYRKNRDRILARIARINEKLNAELGTEAVTYVAANKPESGFFILVDFSALSGAFEDDFSLQKHFLARNVGLVCGSAFGIEATDVMLRLTFSGERDLLDRGMDIIERTLMEVLEASRSLCRKR